MYVCVHAFTLETFLYPCQDLFVRICVHANLGYSFCVSAWYILSRVCICVQILKRVHTGRGSFFPQLSLLLEDNQSSCCEPSERGVCYSDPVPVNNRSSSAGTPLLLSWENIDD